MDPLHTLADWRRAYDDGAQPLSLLRALVARLAHDDTAWIHRCDTDHIAAQVAALPPRGDATPLWGVPFAVKDNIDVQGLHTTAACPAFAYAPALGHGGAAPASRRRGACRQDQPRSVTRELHAYERAFMHNDVDALIGFFWPDARLTRFGLADRQLGIEEMAAFRRASPAPFTRRLENLRISTFGDHMAVAYVEFVRSDSPLRGFQSQTWARLPLHGAPARWFVVAAHVSMTRFPHSDA